MLDSVLCHKLALFQTFIATDSLVRQSICRNAIDSPECNLRPVPTDSANFVQAFEEGARPRLENARKARDSGIFCQLGGICAKTKFRSSLTFPSSQAHRRHTRRTHLSGTTSIATTNSFSNWFIFRNSQPWLASACAICAPAWSAPSCKDSAFVLPFPLSPSPP